MLVRLSLGLVCLLISLASGDKNLSICDDVETNCGLVPPIIPERFIMKSLIVNPIDKQFTWEEKYFDPLNLRAKLVTISKGIESTYIFNYEQERVTSYMRLHPGVSIEDDPVSEQICLTENMADSNFRFFMGYKNDRTDSKVSSMYDQYEAMQFGGPYKYAYVNETMALRHRNVACDGFVGCVYDKYFDQTVKNTFYFSKDLLTASGMLPAPMLIKTSGGYYEGRNESRWVPQEKTNEIVFFDNTPFMTDEMFQPPPRMNCHLPVAQSVKTPKLTEAFSTRIESVITVENLQGEIKKVTQNWYEEIWYDYNRKLIRSDFNPTQIKNKKENVTYPDAPISSVFDFNTGIVYFTDKTYGKCLAMEIPESNDFVIKSPDGKTLDMVTKDDVFDFFNEKMEFKGKYETRDILCNVWSGEKETNNSDGTPSKAYREVYFTTEGWHQETDNKDKYDIPIQETRIFETVHDGQKAMAFMEINFYKFKMEPSPLTIFDISGCIEQIERRSFVMQFDEEFRELINNHKHLFMDAFRTAAVKYGKLRSLLRIQELDIIFNEGIGTVHVYFTILDKTPLKDDHKYPKWFVNLETAIKNLDDNYNQGKFIVELQIDMKAEPTKLVPIKNTFKEVDFKTNTLVDIESDNYQMRNYASDDPVPPTAPPKKVKKEEDTSTRYTPGSVGGLAGGMLIVGILLGIISMLIYMKKLSFPWPGSKSPEADIEFANEP